MKKTNTRKVKGWAVIMPDKEIGTIRTLTIEGGKSTASPFAVFPQDKRMSFNGEVLNDFHAQVVECTITYTLPKKTLTDKK